MNLSKNLAILISALAALPVSAQGFYLGAGVGAANSENEYSYFSSEAAHLKAGYRFNDFVAFEYRSSFINGSTDEMDLEVTNSLYYRGSYQLDDRVELYGLLGVTTATVKTPELDSHRTDHIVSPSYGIGARYAATDNIGVSAEYVAVSTSREYIQNAVFFGVDYQF